MLEDVKTLIPPILSLVFEQEATGASGVDKKKRVVEAILKAVKSEGGIHITSPLILRFLEPLVGAIIEWLVYEVNKLKK